MELYITASANIWPFSVTQEIKKKSTCLLYWAICPITPSRGIPTFYNTRPGFPFKRMQKKFPTFHLSMKLAKQPQKSTDKYFFAMKLPLLTSNLFCKPCFKTKLNSLTFSWPWKKKKKKCFSLIVTTLITDLPWICFEHLGVPGKSPSWTLVIHQDPILAF